MLPNALLVHLDILRQDLRHTVRSLSRSSGFALTAILVAALGVGATTATFSILDHALLRPLPFPEPDRLVRLWQDQTFRGYPQMEVSPPNFRDWQRMSRSFEAIGASHGASGNLVGHGEPRRLEGEAVTHELLPLLGTAPALGRLFSAADDGPGAPGTMLLSDALWKTQFGGDPSVIGRSIRLDDEPFTIIGVMPPSFAYPSRVTRFWVTAAVHRGELRGSGELLAPSRRATEARRLARGGAAGRCAESPRRSSAHTRRTTRRTARRSSP